MQQSKSKAIAIAKVNKTFIEKFYCWFFCFVLAKRILPQSLCAKKEEAKIIEM